ncbi:DUF6907 domain-containing protein [Streptomyces sp. JV180]|uniref:DUF6907 domain-containing protein n=1 Tax=Streptomyces sp. JV180 TaxID=858634 RepID=UPI00168A6D16|nr:hypothetical protein [Streptomyces sp. JV180]MBD3544458.1 hypothetical protein [Streptomyces sp. JV180]
MSGDDRPIVAPEPRRNADGTITITTDDAGEVRVACPPWCRFEHPYRTSRTKAEISHKSEPLWALTTPTAEFGEVGVGPVHISQHPYDPTGSAVLVVVESDTEEFAVGPADARRFAVAFRKLADLIDQTADQVEAIRAGEGQ